MSEHNDFIVDGSDFRFEKDDKGELLMRGPGYEEPLKVGQIAVAFPLTQFGRYIRIVDTEGEEVTILRDLTALDQESEQILQQELEKVYFMPRIRDVSDIQITMGIYRWEVTTDRGQRAFEVRHPRHNIRRIGSTRLIIKDVDGNRYDLPDWTQLPKAAQELVVEYI